MTATSTSPPKARLAYRVGVVGHRPNRLPVDPADLASIRARIGAVLESVAETVRRFGSTDRDGALYSDEPPILRAVSPLAEGSDRMLAEEALRLGFELCCPMPFPRTSFERDFAPHEALEPESVERFDAILEAARAGPGLTVFELDGRRDDDEALAAAYAAAGRIVLNQSDLLVVVWDGGRSAGAGGTVATLQAAISYRVPVIWIDATAPFGWTILRELEDLPAVGPREERRPRFPERSGEYAERHALAEDVAEIVRTELRLPGRSPSGGAQPTDNETQKAVLAEAQRGVRIYFAERRPGWNVSIVWKLFRDVVGDVRLRAPALRTRDYVAEIASGWPISEVEDPRALPQPQTYWINGQIRAHFAWADKLADRYADAYRSAFVLTYLLPAFAVMAALLQRLLGTSHATDQARRGSGAVTSSLIELTILLAVLTIFAVGRSRHWHERWMSYRMLAELIRELRFLTPLGGARPLPRSPSHLGGYGDPARTWVYWHLRSLARATGLPDARATPAHLDSCVESIIEAAVGQKRFHDVNCERYENIHTRLEWICLGIFLLTVVVLAVRTLSPDPSLDVWLVVAGFFPALAAALAGINNHGEFRRISMRSRAMVDGMDQLERQAQELRARLEDGERAGLAEVTALAGKVSQMMVDENMDWRVVVVDRPQTTG